MPDPIIEKPPGSESPAPEPVTATPRRPRRKRSLKIDTIKVAAFVGKTLDKDLMDRDVRIRRRMDRYAKLHGYHVGHGKDFPWKDASDFWVPIMLIAAQRMSATMENAVKSMRPTVGAKSKQRRNAQKETGVDNLLDHQFYTENQGEKKLDDYCTNFTNDECVYWYVPWVREDETIRDVRILPGLDGTMDHVAQLIPNLKIIFPGIKNFIMADSSGWKYEVDYQNDQGEQERATVEFFDTEDAKIEAYITKEVRIFDGPAPQVLDYEDIVRPYRAANLQPPTGANPNGAPYFHLICKTDLNTISRRMADGTYDLLTDKDFTTIKTGKSSADSGQVEDEPKAQKDELGGNQASTPGVGDDRQLIVTFAGWDVNDDGFEEQVIFESIRLLGSKIYPAAMRFLSEKYPGVPLMRPVVNESCFPEPNRIDGHAFIESLEPIQDMSEVSFDQLFDWGTITNIPMGFYRPSSGLKPENMYVEPGVLVPLDSPQQDVFFPQWPTRGESFNINTLTLLQQYAEKLSFSELAFGRIPTGKSAALRTAGTTNALMSQIDVSSERILRRLFHGICSVFQLMHRLNRRYLPEQKQIRIIGMSQPGEDAYKDIKASEIDADMDFEFKATMLNTNKQMLAQVLKENLALKVSPIAIQAGIVGAEQVYNLLRDIDKAQDLDPDRYNKRPPSAITGLKLLAEEAITMLISGEQVIGAPMEPPMEHLQKLMQWAATPNIDRPNMANLQLFLPPQVQAFEEWVQIVRGYAVMEQQTQQMMAAAAGVQQPQQGGPGGVPSTISPDTGTNQPMQPGGTLDGSLQ